MLSCLRIRDLAIIDELEIELGPGLNVLTGETGAGKSVLIGALELVLGDGLAACGGVSGKAGGARTGGRVPRRVPGKAAVGRGAVGRGAVGRGAVGKAFAELVRTGAASGEVEAAFDISGDVAVCERLRRLEVPVDGELIVRRVLAASGKTRAFINGKLATQQMLAEVTRGLADISSQHEHHTLIDASTHTRYLDAFAGADALRRRMAESHHRLCRAEAELEARALHERERTGRQAVLEAQIAEIEEVAPQPGEDAQLEQTCSRLRGMEALLRLAASASELLSERDESVVDALADAARRVARASEMDPALVPLASQLEALQNQLSDAARELGRHVTSMRAEPETLQLAEERLYRLSRLKRRYGGDIERILEELERSRAELEELCRDEGAVDRARLERAAALAQARAAADELSRERCRAASQLGAAISRELESLGMGGALVRVELTPLGVDSTSEGGGARLSAEGCERAEFLIAPNRGEAARPLARVASGGELSRTMLAIKCVLADLGPAGMYVFDEVDSGVGGAMAEVIGRKIQRVAKHRQVLCITHLPQIAVFADHHFKVEKVVHGERTTSTVRRLDEKQQGEEIARMLGGLKITTKTRAAARELLLQARQAAA